MAAITSWYKRSCSATGAAYIQRITHLWKHIMLPVRFKFNTQPLSEPPLVSIDKNRVFAIGESESERVSRSVWFSLWLEALFLFPRHCSRIHTQQQLLKLTHHCRRRRKSGTQCKRSLSCKRNRFANAAALCALDNNVFGPITPPDNLNKLNFQGVYSAGGERFAFFSTRLQLREEVNFGEPERRASNFHCYWIGVRERRKTQSWLIFMLGGTTLDVCYSRLVLFCFLILESTRSNKFLSEVKFKNIYIYILYFKVATLFHTSSRKLIAQSGYLRLTFKAAINLSDECKM